MLRKRRRHDRLSAREYQTAICILEGHRNTDIARLLGINEKTVSTYKCRLFRKFKIKSILELREAMKNMDII
jgi:DNA-binding CsgD family transcriptional regulator